MFLVTGGYCRCQGGICLHHKQLGVFKQTIKVLPESPSNPQQNSQGTQPQWLFRPASVCCPLVVMLSNCCLFLIPAGGAELESGPRWLQACPQLRLGSCSWWTGLRVQLFLDIWPGSPLPGWASDRRYSEQGQSEPYTWLSFSPSSSSVSLSLPQGQEQASTGAGVLGPQSGSLRTEAPSLAV